MVASRVTIGNPVQKHFSGSKRMNEVRRCVTKTEGLEVFQG